jgi:DNA-directed RNA polymerase III subunit RPC3
MQSLLVSGQTRISDLTTAWKDKIDDGNKNNHSSVPMDVDDDDVFGEVKAPDANGDAHDATAADTVVKDKDGLNSILYRLVKAELIDVVHTKSFESPLDVVAAVEKEVADKYFPAGVKGGKGKIDFQEKVAESLRHIRGESKSLKRKLEQNGGESAKRQKLNGALNGAHDGNSDPTLNVSSSEKFVSSLR